MNKTDEQIEIEREKNRQKGKNRGTHFNTLKKMYAAQAAFIVGNWELLGENKVDFQTYLENLESLLGPRIKGEINRLIDENISGGLFQ